MRLYTDNGGAWLGTQAEARKEFGNKLRVVDVPTSKPELLAFLNENAVGSFDALGHKPEPEQEPQSETASHLLSCSAYKPARELNRYDVSDVVLNCDKAHLGAALGAVISRLHDVEV